MACRRLRHARSIAAQASPSVIPRGYLVSEALCATLVVLVIALVAISRNIATMDRTVIDGAIVVAMGVTIDSALTATFAQACAEGQTMTLEEVAEYALRDEG